MAVEVEMQNTGDPALRTEVIAVVEHMLADRAGDWRVSIIGATVGQFPALPKPEPQYFCELAPFRRARTPTSLPPECFQCKTHMHALTPA